MSRVASCVDGLWSGVDFSGMTNCRALRGQLQVDEVERDQRVFFIFDGGGLSS